MYSSGYVAYWSQRPIHHLQCVSRRVHAARLTARCQQGVQGERASIATQCSHEAKKVLGGPRLPGATLDWGVPRSKRFRTRVVIAPHVAHGRDTPPDVPARSPSFACIGKATMPYPPPAAMTPSPNAAIGAGGPPATEGFPTFESIGVRPLINCRGSYTAMSGSLTLPEVKAAMDAAGTGYVEIRELQIAVGERIGALMGTEYGVVTNGCAAALAHITAGCLAGTDKALQARLPFTDGMPNEVIVQKCHRFGYDFAIKASGGKLVEVETLEEMQAAISDNTVMMLFLGDALDNHPGQTQVPIATMTALANEHGIPMVVDAAAERPDVPNEYLEQGADVVCYSGGKVLRGPQSGGLMIGKRGILDAAQNNQSPNGGIGRSMKVGKEEYMGMLAAVEQWVKRDHVKEWSEWERRLNVIAEAVADYPGMEVTYVDNKHRKANVAPELHIACKDGLAIQKALDEGTPRIQCFGAANDVYFMPHMMEPGDDVKVRDRLLEVFASMVVQSEAVGAEVARL